MTSPESPSAPEKSVWSEYEFKNMNWHDTYVHGIAWSSERSDKLKLMLDIDYILAWPVQGATSSTSTFRIAPGTLVFQKVTNFSGELGDPINPIIEKLERTLLPDAEVSRGTYQDVWQWTLAMVEGKLTFRSTGYTLFIRMTPTLTPNQYLTDKERAGVSFACQSC